MSATEQQLLEDFDTNKLQKRVEQTSSRTENIPFRGSLWHATEQPLQAPPRPAPTPQPPMPEGLASSSSAAPPQSLGEPIAEAGRFMEAVPKSIRALEAGRVMEAEGYVLEAHMERGYELEAMRQNAEHSWNRSLGLLGGAEEPSRAEQIGLTDSDIERDPEAFQRASEEETAAAATELLQSTAKMLGHRSWLPRNSQPTR